MAGRSNNSTNISIQVSAISVSFDAGAFDNALRDHGVQFIHWRSMKCPVGMQDRYETRRPHEDHSGCSNGNIYTKAGPITALFTGNSTKQDQNEVGLLDGSSVRITVPRYYDESDEEMMIAPFDRFFVAEDAITVPHKQLVQSSITGTDKLSFPVVRVIDLMDSTERRYGAEDYDIVNGQIVWKPGRAPEFNNALGKGCVYSILYTYRPYWYVDRVLNEVRVAQVDAGVDGRVVTRMPQSLMLTREYVYEKEENDDRAPNPDSSRQVKEASKPIFGPR